MDPATPTTAANKPSYPEPVPAYEIRSGLYDQFYDFDDQTNYAKYLVESMQEKTANFAVRFGAAKAKIATNLKEQDVETLLNLPLQRREQEDLPVTWINIWSAAQNGKIISKIADQYKFSTRLKGSILAWDKARREIAHYSSQKTAKTEGHPRLKLRRTFHRGDLEQGPSSSGRADRPATSQGPDPFSDPFDSEDLKMYGLLQKTYNYTTIDQGTDCTVISIHEAPNYGSPKGGDGEAYRRTELRNMRKNTHDLLSQLSKYGIEKYRFRVASQKGVRSDMGPKMTGHNAASRTRTTVVESSEPVDASANLFYYLFEDYTAPTSFLASSSITLSKLTDEVLHITDRRNKDKDTSSIIKTLYARSRDLRQLKHLFQSYEKLIKDIIELPVDRNDREESMAGSNPNLLMSAFRGVRLSRKANDRFCRLNDRLRLLMLDTIDEYLVEKSSLSDTYFNLLAQKDSQATSALNRSASLLAKLSVFFLPISFMTSYFSVQIPDLTNNYTGTTYWVTFAVIATLSFMSLFFFSRLLMVVSDLLDEKVHQIQKSSWRTIKHGLSGRRKKGKNEETEVHAEKEQDIE
ncbi:hypothetical protein SLS53_006494 [Cytospora paraplurivora]|uniref:Adp-ribosylation factor protein n=1 Tax=Cytospora paraplurivora TaxID=2898453 RepID=A0AAN9U4N0_9PEZI